ncbi:MAG: cob(I)yrinic acid a,c-diamide adenosyltransferase [Tepidisphaera sp.]|nr:cob(I)yrinic acid a,c-diamide adenosyltransferase [Tepidisphaera sp.]
MVKLTKIYTKTGDDGTTGLVGGQRVRKDDLRVEAYGTVDEANAAIGVAVTLCDQSSDTATVTLGAILRAIQHDMFDLGADLATPIEPNEKNRLRIVESQTTRLERTIDEHNDGLAPLTSFVLPGGTPVAAALHVARTVVRRAERIAVALQAGHGVSVNPEAVKYLNRLSDLLFVLSRVANDGGKRDVLWVPGANRGK